MQTLLKHWADALLEWLGLASAQDSGWDRWVAFTLVLLAVALIPAGKSQAAKLPALKVKGTKLMNSRGRTVQLKGVSTHGLSWYPQYVNQKAFTYMKKY